MKHKTCPHCHTYSGLRNYSSLLLTLEDWPMVLLYSVVIVAFGEKFNHSIAITSLFVGLALIPLIFKRLSKSACDNCGIEFRQDGIHEHEKLQVHD